MRSYHLLIIWCTVVVDIFVSAATPAATVAKHHDTVAKHHATVAKHSNSTPCKDSYNWNRSRLEMPECLLASGIRLEDQFSAPAVQAYFNGTGWNNALADKVFLCTQKHFQHFFLCVLSYMSIRIWENRFRHPEYPELPAIGYLEVDGRGVAPPDKWTISFKGALEMVVGKFSRSCGRSDNFTSTQQIVHNGGELQGLGVTLIHPLDMFRIASMVRNKDPCRLVNKSAEILSQPIRVTVLDRETRNIYQLEAIMDALRKHFPVGYKFTISKFEETAMSYQAGIMEDTDVIITPHGAGVTNALFMSPCSAIIEVVPFGYGADAYFREIFSPYFIHRGWHSKKCFLREMSAGCRNNMIHFLETDGGSAAVKDFYDITLRNDSLICPEKHLHHHPLNSNFAGRSCLRSQGVHFDIPTLINTLKNVTLEREKCIRGSSMYNVR
jgi:hypothetical protein